jgi:hypothetical protein
MRLASLQAVRKNHKVDRSTELTITTLVVRHKKIEVQ